VPEYSQRFNAQAAHLEHEMRLTRTILLAAALGLGLGTMAGAADKAPLPPQATIPFVKSGNSIRDWQADGRDGLWIQDLRKQWYYATLLAPCIGLDFATGIGFDTGAGDSLDRFSQIIVPREQRCQIMSLTRSEAPPPDRKKKKKAAADAGAAAEVPGK
jgi:hypothetical protein